jgi:hypothetical protein
MTKFIITNYKYNIKYDLNYDTFSNFIQSLKESKKYYYDLCNKNNINTHNFDFQYIKNIDILQGELLKYFILINNDNYQEQYIVLDDDIRDLCEYILSVNNNCNYSFLINFNYLTYEIMSELLYEYAENKYKRLDINKYNINDFEFRDLEISNFLDNLNYETIHERELRKLLENLYDVCITNINNYEFIVVD